MRGVNKVILVGTLGADPDVKYTANGNTISNLSVATSDEWVDKSTGQKQQKTEWHIKRQLPWPVRIDSLITKL